MSGTWFLDVKAHETWLPHFHTLEEQEIGLHCYEHRYGNEPDADRVNINRGYALLRAAGWKVDGFAAPYGIWTPPHSAFIDAMGFAYSSEFSAGYDTLPFWPLLPESTAATLQVPIHPISIGSLRRVGATARDMREYFEHVALDLFARQMPLFFYHHPTHRHWEVVEGIMDSFRNPDVRRMAMIEYVRWWQQRAVLDVNFDVTGHRIVVTNGDLAQAAEVYLHVVAPDGRDALASPGSPISMTELRYALPRPVTIPGDLRRIRDIDPRRMLGDLYSSMLRRLK